MSDDPRVLKIALRSINSEISGMEGHHAPDSYWGNHLSDLKRRRDEIHRQLDRISTSSGGGHINVTSKVEQLLSRKYKGVKIVNVNATSFMGSVVAIVDFTYKAGLFKRKKQEVFEF